MSQIMAINTMPSGKKQNWKKNLSFFSLIDIILFKNDDILSEEA